jgi:hypothetical protein
MIDQAIMERVAKRSIEIVTAAGQESPEESFGDVYVVEAQGDAFSTALSIHTGLSTRQLYEIIANRIAAEKVRRRAGETDPIVLIAANAFESLLFGFVLAQELEKAKLASP